MSSKIRAGVTGPEAGFFATLFVIFFGAGNLLAESPGPPAHGPLVIIGGALAPDNGPIYRAILEATLPDRPLCLLATASSRPRRSLRSYLVDFRHYGGEDAALPITIDARHPKRAQGRRWARRLENCGGFFFTGGDQGRLVDILRPEGMPSAADAALRRIALAGGVVAGTSAGAAMVSHPMIGDGTSAEALEHGIAPREGDPGVWLRDGMGFLVGALVDQHFLARGRLGRLLVALENERSTRYGFGIDEDTALVIDGDFARVIGRSAVVVIDRGATPDDRRPGRPRLWLLANDDQLSLASGIAHGADDKQPPTRGKPPTIPTSSWQGNALHPLMVAFARSPETELELIEDRLTLRKETGFECLGRGPTHEPRAVFAGPFELEFWGPGLLD